MKKIVFFSLIIVALFTTGCKIKPSNQNVSKNLTYLISKEDKLKYCNGADMDSEGYKKTITAEVKTDIAIDQMTKAELAKATAVAATTGQCQEVLKQIDFKVIGDTVYIAPIEGWAGVSITMCSCQPEVEVNLLRIEGINKVVFANQMQTYKNIDFNFEVKYPFDWQTASFTIIN